MPIAALLGQPISIGNAVVVRLAFVIALCALVLALLFQIRVMQS